MKSWNQPRNECNNNKKKIHTVAVAAAVTEEGWAISIFNDFTQKKKVFATREKNIRCKMRVSDVYDDCSTSHKDIHRDTHKRIEILEIVIAFSHHKHNVYFNVDHGEKWLRFSSFSTYLHRISKRLHQSGRINILSGQIFSLSFLCSIQQKSH